MKISHLAYWMIEHRPIIQSFNCHSLTPPTTASLDCANHHGWAEIHFSSFKTSTICISALGWFPLLSWHWASNHQDLPLFALSWANMDFSIAISSNNRLLYAWLVMMAEGSSISKIFNNLLLCTEHLLMAEQNRASTFCHSPLGNFDGWAAHQETSFWQSIASLFWVYLLKQLFDQTSSGFNCMAETSQGIPRITSKYVI